MKKEFAVHEFPFEYDAIQVNRLQKIDFELPRALVNSNHF